MSKLKSAVTRAMPLILGLGVAAVAIGADEAASTSQPSCEIEAASAGGMIALQGVVHADVAVSGSYRFRVTSAGGAGSTNVSQGGNFTAGPNAAAKLGKVMLGGSGASYDARLDITANGTSVQCAERVGGAI